MDRRSRLVAALACAITLAAAGTRLDAQSRQAASRQKQDAEYTAKIKEYLQDPRITTELVDHLPASDTVPTPLKFLGRIVGTPGELTYAKDIHRYYEALAKAAPSRAKYWKIGKTEEGRDIVAARDRRRSDDQATSTSTSDMLGELTDPRKTTEARRSSCSTRPSRSTTRSSGMHSPETGGPEMLMELAYRLIVEETPFIQNIRNNVITLITPVIEVDGREKQVDTYYFNKKRAQGDARLPLMYWGKYVAARQQPRRHGAVPRADAERRRRHTLEWHADRHARSARSADVSLRVDRHRPVQRRIDPIVVDEWWMLAQERRDGDDQARRARRVDLRVLRRLGAELHVLHRAQHNAIGRFYEVQSYGPDPLRRSRPARRRRARSGSGRTRRCRSIKWGPRNNTNIQESALLFSLNHVAKNKELYLENYWLKNKRAVDKGKNGPTYAWVIPATQRRKADAADAVNELRDAGARVPRADVGVQGRQRRRQGRRLHHPRRPAVSARSPTCTSRSRTTRRRTRRRTTTPAGRSSYMRNIKVTPVTDKSILDAADDAADGRCQGAGRHRRHRQRARRRSHGRQHPRHVPLQERGREDAGGRGGLRAERPQVPRRRDHHRRTPTARSSSRRSRTSASRRGRSPSAPTREDARPRHAAHRLHPQLDAHAGRRLGARRARHLRRARTPTSPIRSCAKATCASKYDVIIFPHVGGSAHVAGQRHAEDRRARRCRTRRPPEFPNLGFVDQSDDIRGGMGVEGLVELAKFVQEGGTLITEGSTATIFPEYGITTGVTVEEPAQLFVRGSILRGGFTDMKSPIAYGYEGADLPVYFNQAPVLNAGRRRLRRVRRRRGGAPRTNPNAGVGQNVTPNALPLRISAVRRADAEPGAAGRRPSGRAARRRGAGAADGAAVRHHDRRHASARRDAVPGESERHAAVGHARRRPVRSPTARRRSTSRSARARRDVRDPPVLAVADAGHLLARLQRDHELERPRRRARVRPAAGNHGRIGSVMWREGANLRRAKAVKLG